MSLISVDTQYLESLIFSYISTNLNVRKNEEIHIYDGFIKIKKIDENNNKLDIRYKVKTIHHKEDYPYISENYNLFYDEVSLCLGDKEVYSRTELKAIAEEMYLQNENNVAFIIKVLRKDVKFINE